MGEEERGPIGLGSSDYWNVSLVLSILELSFAVMFLVLVQTACSLVLRFAKRRMPKMCMMRVALCMLTTLWMGTLLIATPAPWRLFHSAFRLSSEGLSDICRLQLVICHGVSEPSLLTLIVLLFRTKAMSTSGWQPWLLLRPTAIVGVVFGMIQVGKLMLTNSPIA